MSNALEKLKTILAQNPNALSESLAKDPEGLEKIVLRFVELWKEHPDLRPQIRFLLPRLIPMIDLPEDPRQALKAMEHTPLTPAAARALWELVTDADIRGTVQNIRYEWAKFVVAQVLRRELMPDADIPSVFAALGDTDKPIAVALRRMTRIDRNPGGTGRKREREVAESDLTTDGEPSPFETIPDPNTPNPAEVVADEDAVERVLAQVGERTAQLLRLCLQGYSVTEAAQQLGIAPATAWNLLHRVRKKLRRT